jgi:predicted RNase H-like HicB family nuclease
MVMRRFPTILEWDAEDRVWVTYVPSLNHLSTYGETEAGALERTREAIVGYLEAAQKEGLSGLADSPEPKIVELQVAAP